MEVLRTAVSALSFYDPDESDNEHDANVSKSFRLTSQIAMLVAAYDRLRKGKAWSSRTSLSHAANFLWMLNGEKPSATATKTFDLALILHADHELNASTFAARVIAATLSDIHSAITGAIGALKGPLHGGANEAVMRMLFAIDKEGADPVDYVAKLLAQKKKISGFGHRVYHTEDPRATHLRKMSEELGESSGNAKWFKMSRAIEKYILAEKKLNANVDFYSASTYTMLGIDLDLFTPIFAVSRISGWAAHVIEQLDDNRLIRPRAEYIGPEYPVKYSRRIGGAANLPGCECHHPSAARGAGGYAPIFAGAVRQCFVDPPGRTACTFGRRAGAGKRCPVPRLPPGGDCLYQRRYGERQSRDFRLGEARGSCHHQHGRTPCGAACGRKLRDRGVR
jgi:citrate synthase